MGCDAKFRLKDKENLIVNLRPGRIHLGDLCALRLPAQQGEPLNWKLKKNIIKIQPKKEGIMLRSPLRNLSRKNVKVTSPTTLKKNGNPARRNSGKDGMTMTAPVEKSFRGTNFKSRKFKSCRMKYWGGFFYDVPASVQRAGCLCKRLSTTP